MNTDLTDLKDSFLVLSFLIRTIRVHLWPVILISRQAKAYRTLKFALVKQCALLLEAQVLSHRLRSEPSRRSL